MATTMFLGIQGLGQVGKAQRFRVQGSGFRVPMVFFSNTLQILRQCSKVTVVHLPNWLLNVESAAKASSQCHPQ